MFEQIAYASPVGQTAEVNPALSFLPFILLIVIFYFLLIRPQQKRQREHAAMIQNLKKGDRIVTGGGIIGTVVGIQNDYIVMKIGDDDTKMEVLKSAVSGIREKSE